jgi:hypothetical protein
LDTSFGPFEHDSQKITIDVLSDQPAWTYILARLDTLHKKSILNIF